MPVLLKTATFTVRASQTQSERWKRAADAEGYASAGAWLADAADCHLKARARAGRPFPSPGAAPAASASSSWTVGRSRSAARPPLPSGYSGLQSRPGQKQAAHPRAPSLGARHRDSSHVGAVPHSRLRDRSLTHPERAAGPLTHHRAPRARVSVDPTGGARTGRRFQISHSWHAVLAYLGPAWAVGCARVACVRALYALGRLTVAVLAEGDTAGPSMHGLKT